MKLTNREQEVQALVKKGKSNKEISDELHISVNTVKTHVSHILHKRNMKSRIEIIVA